MLTLIAALALSQTASAAEVEWHGHYRSRVLAYSGLSLSDTNQSALAPTTYIDHRMRLQPTFHASSRVSVHAQLDLLNLTAFGDNINTYTLADGSVLPAAYAHGVAADITNNNMGNLGNISLTRAWADVYLPYGRLSMGRMPQHWGAGILFNDGLTSESEFGDTADRIQFTTQAGPVYVMAAYEQLYEGYWEEGDDRDDGMAADVAIAYLGETMGVGLYNRYRRQFSPTFQAYTGSLWGFTELGPARIEMELAGNFGAGDLDSQTNDVSLVSFGGILSAEADLPMNLTAGLDLGMASGDGETGDSTDRVFTMDRDKNIALMLFEEPLPLTAPAVRNSENLGRDNSSVLTGEGVSNALFMKPTIGYHLRPDLHGQLSLIGARTFAAPDDDRTGYGWEIDADVTYSPVEHFYLKGTGAILLPGTYYSNYGSSALEAGFNAPAFGGRLYLVAEF
ncbi:MAG: hypothetical protein VX899_01955 [Myxococcota bacterium]|nr:hypothetical protein [Myxococcota bacterium]